jgi:hypothetical protein
MATRNICDCPSPPGGTVSCEPDQLAICRVLNGVAQRECFDPPSGLGNLSDLTPSKARRYHNWALQRITGQHRSPSQPITPDDERILRDGSYHNDLTGEEISFSLPEDVNFNSSSGAAVAVY